MKKFRIVYTCREWIGKPDPEKHGERTLESDDYSWLQEQSMRISKAGHRIRAIEKFDGAKYCQI